MNIKENEKEDKYLDLAREQKAMEHGSYGDTSCNLMIPVVIWWYQL